MLLLIQNSLIQSYSTVNALLIRQNVLILFQLVYHQSQYTSYSFDVLFLSPKFLVNSYCRDSTHIHMIQYFCTHKTLYWRASVGKSYGYIVY